MPEIIDFEPETQSQVDFQPETLDFSPDPPPAFQTFTEKAFFETPTAPSAPAAPKVQAPDGRNKDGWYIEPGSLPDRILTWFGGGSEALAKAEANRSTLIPGHRPMFAVPIAKAIDTAAESIGGQPRVLQDLVETSTREQKPEDAPIPMVGPQEGTAAQIAAGVANVPIGFANFMLSPDGVATIYGMGLLPKVAQTLVGLGFTAEQVKGFFDAETLQDKITSGVGAALLATVTGIQAKGLRKPASEPEAPPATTERPAKTTPPSVTADVRDVPPEARLEQRMVPVEELPNIQLSVELETFNPSGTKINGVTILAKDKAGRTLGAIEAQRLQDGTLEIFNSNVAQELKGQGHGLALYEKLIQEANGAPIISDTSVSASAANVWEALKRRGVEVEKNQNAALQENGQWSSSDGEPVFSIRPKPPAEPIGVTETIAELERRNAPNLEPIIPKEPAGTKFPEPRLLSGEKQGDLISSTQAEDFRLVSEKGTDYAARQIETGAKAQAAEEARLKAESEQGLLDEFREHQGRGGDELLAAINAEGGLPAKASPRSAEFAGELENVRQELKDPNRKERISYADIFKKDAPDIDTLATRLKAKGFNIETPGDILDLVKERIRSGRPIFGNEAMGAEPFGFGPGAASGKEVLASYELRRFGKRFQETEAIDPAIREATGNRYYEPITNKLTAEEAAKVIEERGTDDAIRLVRDENFAMEPRVRATLAQTLVTKLNQSHAEAIAAGDGARAKGFLDQAVDTAEYLGEFGTRLGQGVQSFAIWSKLTPEGMLESAKRSAKRAGVELTPEQQAEIRRLTAEAHAAPEGIPKQDATKKLADYMVKQTGIPARDLPLSIYYTHILSGVNTHVVNAVDTGLNVLHEVNNLAVSNPRAAASIYAGLMRGLGEGKYDGLLSLQEGRRIVSGKFIESPDLLEVSKFGKKGGVPIAVKGVASKVAKRVAESWPAKPLNAYKYVMRMMSASDAVFFRGAEEARAGLLAHRLAEATGVERAKLKSEVDSILGYDRLPEFREMAAKEGYTGAKAEARATELMIQSRPESLRAEASDYAGVATYNHEPRGVLGYLSNQVAQVSNKYPALKLFVPFTRIVANVTNRGLDNTPMGILRALREKGLSAEERQRVLTRGITGTAGIIGLGVLNATGAITIHGAGPSDREKKRQLRNAGWKPFSMQVGGNYFTYTYTPVGLGLSVLGNYLDSQRYNELSQKDSLTRVAYSMSRIGTTVFSQSFLSGLSNLFTILSGDPGQSVNSLKQFFSSTATAATTPNLVRDVNHLFDPTARKSENIAQDLIRNIPVARLSLRPTLNAFGEPVELSRNRFYSGQSDDPAWRLVVDKNLRVPVVDQTTFVDSEDGYLYAKIAGERMRKYIVSNLTELKRAPDQQAQEMLSKAARGMFDEARQDVVRHGGVKKKRKR